MADHGKIEETLSETIDRLRANQELDFEAKEEWRSRQDRFIIELQELRSVGMARSSSRYHPEPIREDEDYEEGSRNDDDLDCSIDTVNDALVCSLRLQKPPNEVLSDCTTGEEMLSARKALSDSCFDDDSLAESGKSTDATTDLLNSSGLVAESLRMEDYCRLQMQLLRQQEEINAALRRDFEAQTQELKRLIAAQAAANAAAQSSASATEVQDLCAQLEQAREVIREKNDQVWSLQLQLLQQKQEVPGLQATDDESTEPAGASAVIAADADQRTVQSFRSKATRTDARARSSRSPQRSSALPQESLQRKQASPGGGSSIVITAAAATPSSVLSRSPSPTRLRLASPSRGEGALRRLSPSTRGSSVEPSPATTPRQVNGQRSALQDSVKVAVSSSYGNSTASTASSVGPCGARAQLQKSSGTASLWPLKGISERPLRRPRNYVGAPIDQPRKSVKAKLEAAAALPLAQPAEQMASRSAENTPMLPVAACSGYASPHMRQYPIAYSSMSPASSPTGTVCLSSAPTNRSLNCEAQRPANESPGSGGFTPSPLRRASSSSSLPTTPALHSTFNSNTIGGLVLPTQLATSNYQAPSLSLTPNYIRSAPMVRSASASGLIVITPRGPFSAGSSTVVAGGSITAAPPARMAHGGSLVMSEGGSINVPAHSFSSSTGLSIATHASSIGQAARLHL